MASESAYENVAEMSLFSDSLSPEYLFSPTLVLSRELIVLFVHNPSFEKFDEKIQTKCHHTKIGTSLMRRRS